MTERSDEQIRADVRVATTWITVPEAAHLDPIRRLLTDVPHLLDRALRVEAERDRLQGVLRERQGPISDAELDGILQRTAKHKASYWARLAAWVARQCADARTERDAAEARAAEGKRRIEAAQSLADMSTELVEVAQNAWHRVVGCSELGEVLAGGWPAHLQAPARQPEETE